MQTWNSIGNINLISSPIEVNWNCCSPVQETTSKYGLGWNNDNQNNMVQRYVQPKNRTRRIKKNLPSASAGNRTRVCTVAGYYSTTRPLMPYMRVSVDGLILIVGTTVNVLHNAQNLSVFPWNSDYFQKLNISYRVGQVLDVAPTLQVIKVVLQVHNCRSETINEPVQICNHGSPH